MAAASPFNSSRKITERSSRLAYTRVTRPVLCARTERRMENAGGNPAATGEQQKVSLQRARRREDPCRWQSPMVARLNVVTHPVGATALIHTLDRHAQLVIQPRRTRHRIATRQVLSLHLQPKCQKLTWPIPEQIGHRRRNVRRRSPFWRHASR